MHNVDWSRGLQWPLTEAMVGHTARCMGAQGQPHRNLLHGLISSSSQKLANKPVRRKTTRKVDD